MKQDRIKVIIAAQRAIIRVGMRNLISQASDIQVVAEASNGQEAIFLVEQIPADVLILELEMPNMDGLQTMGQLKQKGADVRIILFSLEKDADIAWEMIMRGAWGFLSKQETPDQIVDAVRWAGRGDDNEIAYVPYS